MTEYLEVLAIHTCRLTEFSLHNSDTEIQHYQSHHPCQSLEEEYDEPVALILGTYNN